MCGHVGMIGNLELKDEATMKRLLIYDYFRGMDSTGFASIGNNGTDVKIAKMASHPIDLFDSAKFKDACSAYKSKVFIGHNRAATRGVVNGANAHPYHHGHIIGAHNGTLTPASFKALEEKLGEPYDVDSDALFACIAKFGIKATIKIVEGAWALVWYDTNAMTLNFLRNKERPFWTAFSEDCDKMYWASEYPMIRAAHELSSSKSLLYTEPETYHQFWETPVDTHLIFDIDQLLKASNKRPKARKATILKGKEPAKVVTYTGGTSPFPRTSTVITAPIGGTVNKRTTSTTTSHGGSTPDNNVYHLFGDNEDPLAGYMTAEELQSAVVYGCGWCNADIDIASPGITVMENSDTVLCPSCSLSGVHTSRVFAPDALFQKAKPN